MPPLLIPAMLDFMPLGNGRLMVSLDGVLLSAADYINDPVSGLSVTAVPDLPPPPGLTGGGALRLSISSTTAADQKVAIHVFVPGKGDGQTKVIPLKTLVSFNSAYVREGREHGRRAPHEAV